MYVDYLSLKSVKHSRISLMCLPIVHLCTLDKTLREMHLYHFSTLREKVDSEI